MRDLAGGGFLAQQRQVETRLVDRRRSLGRAYAKMSPKLVVLGHAGGGAYQPSRRASGRTTAICAQQTAGPDVDRTFPIAVVDVAIGG